MAEYEVVGKTDPFLLVRLKQGESIHSEANSMVMMDGTLELKGEMQGGLLRSLTRKFTAGESFFQQKIEAVRGDGQTLLAPNLPGDIMVLEVGLKQYRLNDGAFLAADNGVTIETRRQGIGQALFGGTGGFVIMETTGTGRIGVSGFGALSILEVKAGNEIVVDNAHVVAWDAELRHEMTTSTTKSGGGLLGGIVNSMVSGEGIVQRFSGNGRVVVCSRNQGGFLSWLGSRLPGRS